MNSILQTKKLLITGIPGTGKTTVGNYLRDKHNFVHIDMECENNISKISASPEIFIKNLIDLSRDLVVTWGFVPCEDQVNYINLLKVKGFKLFWLDGDRDSARKEFVVRDSQYGKQYLYGQLKAFDLQLQRISDSNVVAILNPKIINTFDSKHQFKKLEDIVIEVENE